MRPVELEVVGFAAYRDKVVVDFREVDFFALTGPTGSGKSSLIDAMVFALYGNVPRLGRGSVAPAVSAGSDEAKAAFTFEVGGEMYQVARFVRRTESGGAAVKEVRLEGPVSASGVGEVNQAIEQVLSLGYEDFIRTVVLPQGKFAEFLTAKKSDRQGLLRNLLGFDLFSRIANLAKTRRAVAVDRREAAEREMAALHEVDEDTLRRATEKVDSLVALADLISESEAKLEGLSQRAGNLERSVEVLRDHLARLEEVAAPENLEQLSSLTDGARDSLDVAESAVDTARERLTQAETERDQMPSADRRDIWLKARRSLAELDERLQSADPKELAATVTALESAVSGLQEEFDAVQRQIDQVRTEHAAHALASNLSAGDDCPVCLRPIDQLPELGDVPVLGEMEERRDTLTQSIAERESELAISQTRLVKTETEHEELHRQRLDLVKSLEQAPAMDELEAMAKRASELHELVATARRELEQSENAAKEAAARLDQLAGASNLIGHRLTEALVKLAALEPEISSSDDPVVRWKELMSWRDRKVGELTPQLTARADELQDANREIERSRREIEEQLTANGVSAVEPYQVQVATAVQLAKSEVDRISEALRRRADLSRTIERARAEEAVAGTLISHLRVDGFERWMMLDALDQLVAGANDLLADLSSGGFSLHVEEDGDFSVVDHRNADELRSVATLSGGETFLVSLALALSLAETLASKGGAQLDTVILDEGFGTLDEESLDVVAAVLEELSGEGLMVGVITHVKELAQRAPVRYEVTRGARGAQVDKVTA